METFTSNEKPAINFHRPRLSIVVPAYNESENLPVLVGELEEILQDLSVTYEIIIVDDGSRDDTWARIRYLNRNSSRIQGIRLSRNFGHQYALLAGLAHAKGRSVVTMDADLQHPPSVVPELLAQWENGFKVVLTIREEPRDISWFKKYSSEWFYRLFSWLSGVQLDKGMADFRLLDRSIVDQLLKFPEEGLFLRGLVQWIGFPSAAITFQAGARFSGETKYNLKRMLRFAWHGISSFSLVPLRIAVILGLTMSFAAFISTMYAVLSKFLSEGVVPGWASSLAIISFLFGVLFIILGVLGEYIGRIFVQVRGRPRFLISEITCGQEAQSSGAGTGDIEHRISPVEPTAENNAA